MKIFGRGREDATTAPVATADNHREETLYERIGGGPALQAAVEQFYELVMRDEMLRGYFRGLDMNNLKQHQAAFLAGVLGGPGHYSGRDMATAHAGLDITDEHFDRVANLLAATLLILHVPADIRDEVLKAAGSLRDQIVTA